MHMQVLPNGGSVIWMFCDIVADNWDKDKDARVMVDKLTMKNLSNIHVYRNLLMHLHVFLHLPI
jgi:hypothetical protein